MSALWPCDHPKGIEVFQTSVLWQATGIDIHAKKILQARERLNAILSQHTGQPLERIRTDTERDHFIGGH